jgi:hypothetical protein
LRETREPERAREPEGERRKEGRRDRDTGALATHLTVFYDFLCKLVFKL